MRAKNPTKRVSRRKSASLADRPSALDFVRLEDRILYSATPAVTVDAPAEVNIGETAQVTVSFDNASAGDTGYGPWVDVFIDTTGADGIVDPLDPGDPQAADTDGLANPGDKYDGLSLTATPTYLGTSVNHTLLTLDDAANGGLGILHPYAVDAAGNPIYVSTTNVLSAYYSTLNGLYTSGDQLMVMELPFGSFTPDQPSAEITFGLQLSDHADVGVPIGVTALGGFRFGDDALSNPAVDPSIIGIATTDTTNVTAELAHLSKVYNGPENETATGPNYLRTYRINVDIATGQSLTDLHIFDDLADQIQFTQISGSSHAYTVIGALPSTTVPGGELSIRFDGAITGTASSADAWIDIEFYVPRVYDSNGNNVIDGADSPVLAPNSGNDFLVDNQAYGFASWDPVDPRDAPVIVGLEVDGSFDPTDLTTALATANPNATPEHNDLEVSPLVIQKNFTTITNTGVSGHSSGDLLEFTLDFQLSDYFAINDIVIEDTILDGLRWDSTFVPTLQINGNTYVLGASGWAVANYTVNQDFTPKPSDPLAVGAQYVDDSGGVNTGATTVEFRVSNEMITRGQDGKLLGGGVNPVNTDELVDNDLPLYNDAGTTGRIVYRAYILDEFADDFPSGEAPLNPRDVLNNTVVITADVLDLNSGSQTQATLVPYGGVTVTNDDSIEGLTIAEDEVRKDIYAINGILRLSNPANLNSAENPVFTNTYRSGASPTGAINLQPGDEITYRLYYTIPTGDVEQLRLTDYFPLPVFNVTDPSQTGSSSWSFVNNLTAGVAPGAVPAPASGQITYGPAHTLHTVSDPFIPVAGTSGDIQGDPEDPYLSGFNSGIDAGSNFLRIQWGDFASTANLPAQLDLLLTVTVSDDAFADGLFLTNQVQSGEGNTQSPGTESVANAVIQIVLNQPDVQIYKGVVASTQGAPAVVGGLTFDAIGVGSDDFSGTLTGAANAAALGALNLDSGVLPDAGDYVRFALVAMNVGRSDAFDVTVRDTVRGSYVNNYADLGTMDATAFSAATNFRVFRGDGSGTQLVQGVDYTLSWNNTTKTFEVELTDAYDEGNAADSQNGGLSRGRQTNVAGVPDVADGSNAIIILYDLTVDTDAQASSTVTNTAALTNYAGDEGAQDHTAEDPFDTANVVIAAPDFTKVLTSTEINEAGNNAPNQAVIGELVTYTLTITVPEGTTANAQIIDTLDPGLAFVGITSVTTSAGVSAAGLPGVGINPANVTVANNPLGGAGNQLTFALGTITDTNTDNGVAETITIVYQAVVINTNSVPVPTSGNQSGTNLNNSADFSYSWTNDDGTLIPPSGSDSINSFSNNVSVVEPTLSVDKQSSADNITYTDALTNVDAGDFVYYRIRITNPSGNPSAFDLALSDTLPTNLGSLTVVSTALTNAAGGAGGAIVMTDGGLNTLSNDDFAFTGSVLALAGGRNMDLAGNSRLEIIVRGTLDYNVVPNQSISNTASVTWTSMDGNPGTRSVHNVVNSVERTGADGAGADAAVLNNYAASDATGTTIRNPNIVKSLIATSESHTTGNNVAIGEIVRYRLTYAIPEGTIATFNFRDNLPNGLQFLNDGSATVAFVSNGPGITSTTLSGTGLNVTGSSDSVSPTFVLTGGAISEQTPGVPGFTNGEDPFFNFGNLLNSDDDADSEFIVVEFNALVLNSVVASNDTGDTRANTARPRTGTTDLGSTNSNSISVTVQEPSIIDVDKSVSAGPFDAGDAVTYSVTFSNANGANNTTAFDLILSDNLPSFLENIAVTGITVTGNAVAAVSSSSVVGNLVTVNIDHLDKGATVTITYTADIKADVPAQQTILNTAALTYTSLPGSTGTGLTVSVEGGTVTSTPSVSGSDTGERNGSGTGTNDYTDSDSASLSISVPTVDKQWKDGSLSSDDTSSPSTSNAEVVIGEVVTYDILVTLPEGETRDLVIRDFLPLGLRIDSYQVITLDASSALLTADFNGTVTAAPTATLPTSGVATVTFDFGDVTTNDDLSTSNNAFVLRVFGTVINISANQQGVVRTNTADLQFTNPNNSTTTTIADVAAGNNPSVTIVEPQLTITKVADAAAADAGDPITYTITITNSGSYFAYDVDLSDTLSSLITSPVILNGVGDFSATGFTVAPVVTDFEITGGNVLQNTALSNIDMDPGAVIVLKVQGVLSNSVSSGQSITNTATATFTSLDDDQADGNDADERTGADGVGGALNDYAVASTVVTTAVNNPTVVKALTSTDQADTLGSNVSVGEQITYTLTVTFAEGLSESLSIFDIAQDNANGMLEILSAQISAIGGNITNTAGLIVGNNGTLSSPGTSALNNQATFFFGDVTNTADNINDANDQITITVTARVANLTVNQSSDVLSNSGRVTYGPGGATTLNSTAVNVTVVEPDLNVAKTITSSTANIDAGDTVTYQIVVSHTAGSDSNAYDIILADTMPGILENYTLVSAVISDGVLPSTDVASSLNLTGAGVLSTTGDIDLLLNTSGASDQVLTITITATVKDATNVGTSFTNTVDIDWSSLNGGLDGDDAGTIGERTGGGSNPPNDYSDSSNVPAATVGILGVTKGVDKADATIGEVVTYTVTVTVAEGRTVINLADTLPSGVTLVANSGVLTTPTGWTISGFTNNSASQTLTVINPGASGGTTNNAATLDSDTFTYTYQAVVNNVLTNQNGFDLVNDLDASADLNNDGDTGDAGETDNNNTATVNVIEPRVTIDKTATPTTGLNAGDVVTYTVVLDNLAVNGATSKAFDVLLSDTVPSGILITGITSTTLAGGATTDTATAITGGGTGLSGQYDIPVGGSVTIVYTATIQTSILPGQSLINDADASFTSLDGVVTGERTGANIAEPTDNTHPTNNAVLNNYGVGDTVTVTALSYAPLVNKSIVSTSEAGSTGTDLLIGEIVRYQLKVELFEGTLNDLVIRDNLPTGLQFLNDGTATLTFTNVGTSITGASLAARDSVTGAGVVFTDGTDIFFQLGDVVNNDNDANVEYAVIQFNALVLNTTGNQNGDTRDNNFAVLYDADNNGLTAPTAISTLRVDANDDGTPETTGQSVSNTVTTTLREAVLSFSETIPAGVGYDAGDTFTITYTITNSGSVPAYNVRLADLALPAEFNVTAITFTNTGTGGTVTDSTDLGTDSIDAEISQIAAGATWTIEATVTLRNTVNPSDVYSNPADVTFTSLPGANGTTGNATGSDTPGAAGAATGERTGADGVGGALNDYALTDTEGLSIPAPFSVGKAANVSTAAIGDIVTYTVTVTVIEGTTTNIVLNDTLPTGMTFVANSAVLTNANGMTITGFNTNSLDQTLTSVLNPGASDSTATAATDTFTYTYQALVENVAGNQKGTTLVNDLDASGDGVPPDNNNQVTVTVVEPDLNVAKTITSSTANIDAGDTVTYQIVVSHTAGSDSNAYDIILADTMPGVLENYTLVSAVISDGVLPSTNVASLLNLTGAGVLSTTGDIDLLLNTSGANDQVLTITITATVKDATNVGTSFTNTVDIDWSSLDGGLDGDDSGTINERTGGGSNPPNDYSDSDNVTAATVGALSVSKVADVATATIGDIITYTVSVTVAEGLTVVNLADTLPAGVSLVANSAVIVTNPLGMTITGFNANSQDQTLTVQNNGASDGTTNDAATLETDTFTYTYQVRVLDVIGNDGITAAGDSDGQTALINDVDSSADLNNDGDTTDPGETDNDNQATVTVIEPILSIVKSHDDADREVTPGVELTYTLVIAHRPGSTATAYDVAIRDLIPSGLTYVAGSVTVAGTTGSPVGVSVSNSGASITGVIDELPVGSTVTITYHATVNLNATPGANIDNNARIYWDTQVADEDNIEDPADATTPVDGGDRDYGPSTPGSVEAPNPNADTDPGQDTERVTVGTGSISDFIWNDLDGDGVQDPLERGIGSVQVFIDLNNNGTYDSATELTDTTDVDGQYLIDGLAAGTYTVRVLTSTLPASVTQTYDLNGPLNHAASVILTSGQDRTDVDFGYIGAASAGDRVWLDLDGNGAQNALEPGVEGVTIDLLRDLNGDGDALDAGEGLIAQRTTDANGDYLFAGMIGGDYIIRITDTSDVLADATNTYDLDDGTVTPDEEAAFVLGSTQNRTDVDFGYQGAASLGDRIWNDLDGDGTQDAGEFGVTGLTVQLEQFIGGSYVAIATTTTGTDGVYGFSGLIADGYRVVVTTPPASSTRTYDLDGVLTPDQADRTLTSMEQATDVDFGYQGSASIGDFVWYDADNDGVQDGIATEPAIPGVRVYLDINGDDVYDSLTEPSATTDANGLYSITGLVGGTYTAHIDISTLPAGYVATYDLDGNTSADETTFVLGDTEDKIDVDFGYIGTLTVSGRSYHDLLKDGDFDGSDTGLGGVTIDLIFDANDDGAIDVGDSLVFTTTTAADGTYSFNQVISGNYLIRETQLVGYGSNEAPTNLIDIAVSGADVTDNDFGNTTGSIAGHVYLDMNDDGVVDPDGVDDILGNEDDEIPLEGVSLTLTWSGEDNIFGNGDDRMVTMLTNANGNYLFNFINTDGFVAHGDSTRGLLATGSYRLTETQPDDYLDGIDTAGDASDAPGVVEQGTGGLGHGADEITDTRIGPVQEAIGYNFGELLPSSISGSVHEDFNSNGVRELNEPGIAGSIIMLTGKDIYGRPVSLTTTTDANGNYKFDDLYASDSVGYTLVQLLQPAGFYDGLEGAGTAGGLANVEYISGIVLGYNEDATDYTFGEVRIPPPKEKPKAKVDVEAEPEVTVLDTYFYNYFENFLPYGQDEEELDYLLDPPDEGIEPMLPIMPMYSGHAEPGSTIVVEIRNIHGVTIGTETVMADAGGNWLAKFASNVVYDTPTKVSYTVTRPTYTEGSENAFNMRTCFAPAINPSHFFTEKYDINSVLSEAAANRMEIMQKGNEGSQSFDWNSFNYEFLSEPGVPSS